VTEIGEKEKMKNKLLATMLVLALLSGMFAIAINVRSVAAQPPYTLTINTSPIYIETEPDSGVYTYDNTAWQNVTAPLEYAVGTTKYVFLNWTVTPKTDDWPITPGGEQYWVHVDQNKTATAYYKVQYLFTVITPYDTACIWDPSLPGWRVESSRWFDAGTVGVRGGLTTYQIVLEPSHRVTHTGWSGDASGAGGSDSNPLNMTKAKTAVADWVHEYYLWTGSSYYPWDGGTPYNPDKQNWYEYCTYVNLTAPTINQENYHHWRWRFDHWEIKGWNYTSGSWYLLYKEFTENITVHMDATKYCVVYFHLQYYLDVQDSPSALDTCVETQSGYYDYCTNKPLHAPAMVPDPTDPMKRWKFWRWTIFGYKDWPDGQNDITLHINQSWADISPTIYARYTEQFCVNVTLDPVGVPTSAIVKPLLGENWFDKGATCNTTALSYVSIDSGKRYRFDRWTFDGWTPGAGVKTHVFAVWQGWKATAHYVIQYHYRCYDEPINGVYDMYDDWADNDTLMHFYPPTGPISGDPYNWVLDYLKINTAVYPTGAADIRIHEPLAATAYYKGVPTFFVNERNNIYTVPAKCKPFTVGVTAANLVDLYATDFTMTWDPALLELVGVQVNVSLWKHPFWWNTTTANSYRFVGTETGLGSVGYNGTWTIVKLTFHIIYDPCYIDIDYYKKCTLDLTVNYLSNRHGDPINADMRDAYYKVFAIEPYFKILCDGEKTVTKSKAGDTFTATVMAENVTKLHSWHAWITYDSNLLQVTGARLIDTFLKRDYVTAFVSYATAGWVEFWVETNCTTASGTGPLASIDFKVKKAIIWTNAYPTLTDTIKINRLIIDFLCPERTVLDTNDPFTYWWLVNIRDPIAYEYDPIPGDLNMDGIVNELDLRLIAKEYCTLAPPAKYDIIISGHVDLFDLVAVAINIGRTTP